MPQKRRSQSWTDLKQAGNECFKTGQYGEAAALYSQAIKEVEKSGKRATPVGQVSACRKDYLYSIFDIILT